MVSTRSSSVRLDGDTIATTSTTTSRSRRSTPAPTTTNAKPSPINPWRHTPDRLTLAWMVISLPLVIWDTIYVLGRPMTMEGGSLHWPLWVPYKLYGEVDHVYGWKAIETHNGFSAAQASLNAVETAMYLGYLWMLRDSAGSPLSATGRRGAKAVLVGFSAAVMTLSKTVLYWLQEYFSDFSNIGHNPAVDLLFLWIIPNGAWLIGSAYMIWSLGCDIIDGLTAASEPKRHD